MKIIHIITGLNNGGAEAVIYRLSSLEQKFGNEHHIVSMMDRGIYTERLEHAGVTVDTLGMPRGRLTIVGLFKLYKIIKTVEPDVVQTWMYHADLIGGILSKFAGVNAISWNIRHSNFDAAYNNSVTLVVVRLCALLSWWIPTKIICCSIRSAQIHKALRYRSDKFVIVPNGYALDKFKPDLLSRSVMRKNLAITDDVFVFGMVARFDPQKDHQNLLKSLGLIKQTGHEFTCLLVGTGMDESNSSLMKTIVDLELTAHIILLGARNDIPAIMNALDVHILSSSYGEAFPNVLAEAMACSTPCVTTDVGDAALIVGDYGWVVPAKNSEALANGLIQAKTLFETDQQAWQGLQQKCRAHIVDNFELHQMCERYREVWQMCMPVP